MNGLIRAEAIKLMTTRTAVGLVAGATAVAGLGAFSTIMSAESANLGGPLRAQNFFLLASINLSMFALVIGIRSFTDEFRYGSIVPTLLLTPSRSRVLFAKVVTSAVAGVAMAAVAMTATVLLAALLMNLKGTSLNLQASDIAALGGLMVAAGLWSAAGAAVGAIVRHQVPAIVGALIWVLLLENLGSGLLGDAGRFLPGQAAHALAQATRAGPLLSPPAGALLLLAYVTAVSAIGLLLASRRDVAPA